MHRIDACGRFSELEAWNPKIKVEEKKLRGKQVAGLNVKWEKELARKWPHCLLFCKHVKQSGMQPSASGEIRPMSRR